MPLGAIVIHRVVCITLNYTKLEKKLGKGSKTNFKCKK